MHLSFLLRSLVDFLLPPLCMNCQRQVTEDKTLCARCWKEIRFIGAPLCACCGGPFDLPVDEGTLCGACLANPPVFDAARAVFLYDEASKGLVLRLKHADQLHLVPALGAWIARTGESFGERVDVVAPVPLHRWRLLKRRYNQAALLAQEAGKKTGRPVVVDLLERVRATESQGRKSRKERIENMKGAFALSRGADVSGKNILLVDDVYTTGATVSACCEVLKKHCASRVYVVTLARVRVAS